MKKIILASQSPRRYVLLKKLIPDFEVLADESEEEKIPHESPEDMVQRLAKNKAMHIAERIKEDALILAADTVVAVGNRVLGKPKDQEDAFAMLSALSGKTHQVYTGIAVVDKQTGKRTAEYEVTTVRFRTLEAEEIQAYIQTGEPMDKAGAYGIQEKGALLIEGIEGDYFNVVGLPLCRLGKLLQREYDFDLMKI